MRRIRSTLAAALGILADALVPAALTAAGFALVAAGLLTYLSPVAAAPSITASPSAAATSGAPSIRPTLPGPTASAAGQAEENKPSRIVIPALGIDLAVIESPPNEKWPICGAAEYFGLFSRPGKPGATFIYSHARTGMFLPFLTASQKDVTQLKHMLVVLYTDNDKMFTYEITDYVQHHPWDNLDDAFAVKTEQLWMQTSEGPYSYSPKLEVIATPLGEPLPADHAAAHPTNKGYTCPDAGAHS